MASWTVKRAEKINGLAYVVVKHNRVFEISAWDGQKLVAIEYNRDKDEAIRLIVEAVYRKNALEVYEQQKGRCALCGGTASETDHIKARSKGRDDRKENLRSVCSPCHRKRHG